MEVFDKMLGQQNSRLHREAGIARLKRNKALKRVDELEKELKKAKLEIKRLKGAKNGRGKTCSCGD